MRAWHLHFATFVNGRVTLIVFHGMWRQRQSTMKEIWWFEGPTATLVVVVGAFILLSRYSFVVLICFPILYSVFFV